MEQILYGGDYNPEQWPEETWQADLDKLKEAGINTLTLNVFSWALLQKSEDEYDFSMLDKIIDLVSKNGFKIILATSTAALPAWMVKKYPDVSRMDYYGRTRKHGHRHNHCPNSPTFKKFSPALAGKLAERYGHLDNLVAWHISNEYGGICYCENCEKEYRKWLQEKYGSIEELNKAWNTNFWSHTYYDFDEIGAPSYLGDGMSTGDTAMAGNTLDWRRFNTDSLVKNYVAEREAIRKYDPDTPMTTNLMGDYEPLDYRAFAREMDFISWDNYPALDTPFSYTAMRHDLMRSLKDQKPFWLMEQTPSQQNWMPYNSLKRPGQMRLMSMQAMAHGADHILFFQMKQSVGGCEKFHGAVIGHSDTENTRTFREVQALGHEFEALKDQLIGAKTPSKTALLFDWQTWWGLNFSSGPNVDLHYNQLIFEWYNALNRRGIDVDLIGKDQIPENTDQYEVVLAPMSYMMEQEEADKLEKFASGGGKVVIGTMSGLVGQSDNVHTGGYPGVLRKLAGVWVEEIDSLLKDEKVLISMDNQDVHGKLVCDIMHLEGAKPAAVYEDQFYKGTPAAAVNQFGEGKVWYIGFVPEADALAQIIDDVYETHKPELPEGVEVVRRKKDDKLFTFVMNHTDEIVYPDLKESGKDLLTGKDAAGVHKLKPFEVLVLEEKTEDKAEDKAKEKK